MKPYIVAAIFARGGSKGVPKKNIRLLGGKPLIAHTIESAKSVPLIDRIIVSTDCPEIAQIAKSYGAEVPFMRPAELAQDHSPEWLAWRHALTTLQAKPDSKKIDVLVTLPTTSPFRNQSDITNVIDRLLTSDADVVITTRETDRNPYFNMVTLDSDFSAQLVMSNGPKVHRRQDAPKVFDITTVAYAARSEFVLNCDSIFAGKVKAVLVPAERALDIDTELDFKFAEFLIQQSQPK